MKGMKSAFEEGIEYTKKVIEFPDGCTVEVYRPILPKEEYDRRHKQLEKAAERFLKHVESVRAAERKSQ